MQFDNFNHDRIQTNGTTLNVLRGGTGPAVVLLHGWCGSSWSWRKLAPLLADAHEVIVPDMRGYGGSDKPDGGYDAQNEAADVLGLLDHFGVARAHVVGHDMGAPVALAFSGLYPGRTASVTWVDEPLLGFDTERYTAFTDWNHGGFWQFGFNTTPGLAELMYAGREEAFLTLIYGLITQVKDAVTPEDVRMQAGGMTQPGGIAGWVGWYRATLKTGAQLRTLAGRHAFRSPTLAVGGSHGIAGIGEEIKQAVPHAKGAVIEGCGHLVAEERPDELAALLRAHFGQAA